MCSFFAAVDNAKFAVISFIGFLLKSKMERKSVAESETLDHLSQKVSAVNDSFGKNSHKIARIIPIPQNSHSSKRLSHSSKMFWSHSSKFVTAAV